MMTSHMLQTLAGISVERMLYSLIEGTVLALGVWLALRLLPRRNAGTRFTIWFSVLLFILLLPFAGHSWKTAAAGAASGPGAGALLTLPVSWAVYVFFAWMIVAALSLARVVVGLWQIHSLRRSAREIAPETLPAEIQALLQGFQRSRHVALCSSDRIQVPTAIGFLNPAVVVPSWLLEELPAGELKQVLVHELTHLRRRDDWTNLAQKIVKALLFFHPSVWWVERQLSMEREMACDDAVLAHTGKPRDYAACLTRIAQRNFTRRQMALAQAAVERMRQLSSRVAQILDARRPGSTRLWKPAIPLVTLAAFTCVFSAGTAPQLISFTDSASTKPAEQQAALARQPLENASRAVAENVSQRAAQQPHVILASLSLDQQPAANRQPQTGKTSKHLATLVSRKTRARTPQFMRAGFSAPRGDYYIQQQVIFAVSASGQTVWQVRTWQIQIRIPADDLKNQLPRKST